MMPDPIDPTSPDDEPVGDEPIREPPREVLAALYASSDDLCNELRLLAGPSAPALGLPVLPADVWTFIEPWIGDVKAAGQRYSRWQDGRRKVRGCGCHPTPDPDGYLWG